VLLLNQQECICTVVRGICGFRFSVCEKPGLGTPQSRARSGESHDDPARGAHILVGVDSPTSDRDTVADEDDFVIECDVVRRGLSVRNKIPAVREFLARLTAGDGQRRAVFDDLPLLNRKFLSEGVLRRLKIEIRKLLGDIARGGIKARRSRGASLALVVGEKRHVGSNQIAANFSSGGERR